MNTKKKELPKKVVEHEFNETIVTQFLGFYYEQLNNRNVINLHPHLKFSSVFVRENHKHKGPEMIQTHLQAHPIQYAPSTLSILFNGDRNANVLVTGWLNNNIRFAENIHISYSNDKEFWLRSSLLQTL